MSTRRRRDHICPCCKTRQRDRSKGGRLLVYCKPCYQEKYRQASYRRLTEHTDKPCRMCGKRPRAVSEAGWQYDLCHPCRRENSRRNQSRVQANLHARIDAGEVIMCRCGKHPVHVTASLKVQQYCRACLARYSRTSKRRRRAAAD